MFEYIFNILTTNKYKVISKTNKCRVTLNSNDCKFMRNVLKLTYYGQMSDKDDLSYIVALNLSNSKTINDIGHLRNLEILGINNDYIY